MAEAFGLAASVLSVASLAIQLGDSLQKAYEFWDSIEDGPKEIRRISTELRLLANFFRLVQHEYTIGAMDPVQEQLVKGALEIAKKDIDELASVVSELARAIGPDQTKLRRRWGRVRIALKEGRIEKMKAYIESAKSILNLLQASRTQSTVCQISGKLDLLAKGFSISTTRDRLPSSTEEYFSGHPPAYECQRAQPPTSLVRTLATSEPLGLDADSSVDFHSPRIQSQTSVKSIEAGLAVLTLRSTATKLLETSATQDGDEDIHTKKMFVVNLLWRFASCRRGFRFSFNDAFDTWTFNTLRKRPMESQIFDFCLNGNTSGVDHLLRFGNASIFDTDPYGSTPLHYACRNGHSDLARLLIDRGSDIYTRNDRGYAPIDSLEEYDKAIDAEEALNRGRIAKIVDAMIRYANFDPFEWADPNWDLDTLTLCNGLPYENLQYLIAQDNLCPTPEQRFDFILANMLQIRDWESIDSNKECIDLLLIEYEKLRSSVITHGGWRFNFTLLQHLIFHWLDRSEGQGRGAGQKITQALKLTNDLYRRDREGTPLDTVARYDSKMIPKWLELLSQNGINLSAYSYYEQAQHHDGLIHQGPDACCRIIEVKFKFDQANVDWAIDINNICDPRFEYLDPEYRCEPSRRRELCISQMDDAFIGMDGKPLANIPGSWTTSLKPNWQLPVTLKFYEHGWQYTDFLEAPYKLWQKDNSDEGQYYDSDSIASDRSASSDDDEDDGDIPQIGESQAEVFPLSKTNAIDRGPTQKSPRSGREAPRDKSHQNATSSSDTKDDGNIPKLREGQAEFFPPSKMHDIDKGPTQKSPRSGREAPSTKSPCSSKQNIPFTTPLAQPVCEKVPCLKTAYEYHELPQVGNVACC